MSFSLQCIGDILFAVDNPHLHSKFIMDMLGEMLCGIYTAMLTSSATEAEHQRGETSLDITAHMGICQLIYGVEEGEYLAVVLKESDDWFVKTSEFLIRLVSSGTVSAAAVEDISSAVARRIVGDYIAIREATNSDYERTLAIVFRETD